MLKPKEERVALILQGLAAAPTPDSAEEAVALIHSTVNAVEDQHSGAPYQQDAGLAYQGRMYGPRNDRLKPVPGGVVARTAGNYLYFFHDGSFVVLTLDGRVVAHNHHPIS